MQSPQQFTFGLSWIMGIAACICVSAMLLRMAWNAPEDTLAFQLSGPGGLTLLGVAGGDILAKILRLDSEWRVTCVVLLAMISNLLILGLVGIRHI